MPDGCVPLLISLILLVLLSGFFSSTETAYSCVSRIKLKAMAEGGNKKASKVLYLSEENYDKLISTILVGNNIVNLSAATISALFFSKILSGSINASVVSTAVITVAVLIFGEITPKFVAKVYPEKTASAFLPLVTFFYYLFYPFNFIFSGWKWLIAKIFRLKHEDVITEEEIMTVVKEAEEDGTIKKEETNLIRSVIEFDDLEVGDILVPRVNMVTIDLKTPMEQIKDLFIKEGYSRLPVYKDNIDSIVGTIHEKDFFIAYFNGEKDVADIMQKAVFTYEHVKISTLLKQLQKKKIHIAIVLDEYGGTMGLVTLEDILEELVGEIWDEHDEEVNYYKKLNANTFLVDGKAPLWEMFENFGHKGEEENFEANTVNGWVIEKLSELPQGGSKFDYLNLTVEVMKATVRRVLQIKVTLHE